MVNLVHLLILCNTAEVSVYRYTELNQAPPPSQQTKKSFYYKRPCTIPRTGYFDQYNNGHSVEVHLNKVSFPRMNTFPHAGTHFIFIYM